MSKFLFDVFQIAIVLRLSWALGKYLLTREKRRKRSVVGYKIKKIMSNAACRRLDNVLERQKQKKAAVSTRHPSNVISIAKYKAIK